MLRISAVVCLCLVSSACERDTRLTPAQTAAVADTVTRLSKSVFAAAEKADVDGVFRNFSPAADAAHLNGGARFTRDSLLALYRQIFASIERQEIVMTNPTVTVLGPDAAVFSASGHFVAFPKSGKTLASDAAWTFVWVKRDGEWTLLDSHQSLPRPVGG